METVFFYTDLPAKRAAAQEFLSFGRHRASETFREERNE